MSIRNDLLEKISEVAAKRGADLTAEALYDLSIDKRRDDPLVAMVLEIASGWVRSEGPELAAGLIDRLADALDGDLTDLHNIEQLDALALAQLVEVYQQAEADKIKAGKKWARKIAQVLHSFSRVIGPALIGVI